MNFRKISPSDEEYVEIELVDNSEEIYIDCSIEEPTIELKMAEDEQIDLYFKDFIASGKGEGNKTYTVIQADTSDITKALKKVNTKIFNQGDILVISNNEQAAGYIYTREYGWIAFDGDVTADNILFTEDIICAGDYTQVGNITKGKNDAVIIPAKDKSLSAVMRSIFTKELQPTKTEPSVNITFGKAGAYEVGTTITPSYSASLSPGSYTYGPATGVFAESWNVIDSNGNSSASASDSFPSFVVKDDTNYKITATATHNEGTVAYTNLGSNSDPEVKIAAGTKSKVSSTVTGYRCTFSGKRSDAATLTSAIVRSMTNEGRAAAKTITIKANGTSGLNNFVVAIPTSSKLKITQVMKTDGLATDITSQYSKIGTVSVDGVNNQGLFTSYDIWMYQPASIDSGEIHEIKIG